jgi:hypothetical protein
VLSYRSVALWLLGYPEAAIANTNDALNLAGRLVKPLRANGCDRWWISTAAWSGHVMINVKVRSLRDAKMHRIS